MFCSYVCCKVFFQLINAFTSTLFLVRYSHGFGLSGFVSTDYIIILIVLSVSTVVVLQFRSSSNVTFRKIKRLEQVANEQELAS